jgi:uncharacterized protein (DUF433 family)
VGSGWYSSTSGIRFRSEILVGTVRRYSKQPHLWRTSKRLAMLLANPMERPTEPPPSRPHVHKLAQRLTAQAVIALQEAYQAGASLVELQRHFGLSRGSVQRVLREAGVRRRRKGLTDTEVAGLIKRYRAGLTIREIAAEQGLAKTTVQDALARAGLAMRPAARRKTAHGPIYKSDNFRHQVK